MEEILKIHTFRIKFFKAFYYLLWNTLPLELRLVGNINLFKQKLKTYLFTEFLNSGS